MAASVGRRPTALVVDDHPGILMAAHDILQNDCELLATANNGKTAIEIIRTYRPDIVILDVAMPGMSGFEAARHLREIGSSVKVVFLTVMEDHDYAHAAQEIGASYVLKRRMRLDLTMAVKETLAGRSFFSSVSGQ